MKLLYVTIEYPPDPYSAGIGNYTKTIAELFASRGHEVHVIARAYGKEGDYEERGVCLHRIGPGRLKLPEKGGIIPVVTTFFSSFRDEFRYRKNIAAAIKKIVKERNIDLIEAADHGAEALFYRPSSFPSVPFVVRLHTPVSIGELFDRTTPEIARKLVAGVERRFLRRATHLSGITRGPTEFILHTLKVRGAKVGYAPNPPTMEPLSIQGTPASYLETDEPTILFVGRITPWKGVNLLIDAVPAIIMEYPKARFVLVGNYNLSYGGYPNMKDFLLSRIPKKLWESVRFEGIRTIAELESYYRMATICVFPSYFDTFGYTCLEAMCHGKAIVASGLASMAELLDQGSCGLLFNPPDVASLSESILRLLRDPSLRKQLGEAARERALSEYSTDAAYERILSYYRQSIADLEK